MGELGISAPTKLAKRKMWKKSHKHPNERTSWGQHGFVMKPSG
jgi:hypothetical protein